VIRRSQAARPVAVLAAAALVLSGCTGPTGYGRPVAGRSGSAAPAASGGPAQWSPCPENGRGASNATFDCATIKVPQDWAAPDDGKTFDLALVRVRSSRQGQRIGSLVVNPGGPGGSGFDLAVSMARWLPVDVL